MSMGIKIALGVLSLACIALVATLGLKMWTARQGDAGVEAQLQTVQKHMAEAASPNQPNAESAAQLRHETMQASEAHLAQASSAADKASRAAQQFFGFYLVNVKYRAEFCSKLGVDISPFTTIFTERHRQLYDKAHAIEDRGAGADKEIDMINAQLGPQFTAMAGQAMTVMSREAGITPIQLCDRFRTSPQRMSDFFYLPTVAPALYQALNEAS